jgi:hypothetical protein
MGNNRKRGESGMKMTRRDAATSVICCFNSCRRDCPLYNHARISCSGDNYSTAELLKIARKEYARKSRDAKTGKEYRQMMAKEWKMIGGATVV